MNIKTGDVFRWETIHSLRYYLIDDDLVHIGHDLAGLHWCRLYSVDQRTGRIEGYRTVLSPHYFFDMNEASGGGLTQVKAASEKRRILEQVRHTPTPLRHLRSDASE